MTVAVRRSPNRTTRSDTIEILVELYKRGLPFVIPETALVQGVLKFRGEALTPIIDADPNEGGSDWNISLVYFKFEPEDTADLDEDWVTLEVKVDDDGDVIRWHSERICVAQNVIA